MTDAEKAVVKSLLHELVDKDLPGIVAAEEGRLPATYEGLVEMVVGAVMPKIVSALDLKIDAL